MHSSFKRVVEGGVNAVWSVVIGNVGIKIICAHIYPGSAIGGTYHASSPYLYYPAISPSYLTFSSTTFFTRSCGLCCRCSPGSYLYRVLDPSTLGPSPYPSLFPARISYLPPSSRALSLSSGAPNPFSYRFGRERC